MTASIGIVAGLKAELRCLPPGLRTRSACTGGNPGRAEVLARGLVEAGVFGLVSFGLAGGLDPALRPGALVLAASVAVPDGTLLSTDGPWREAVHRSLLEAGLTVVCGRVAGCDRAVTVPADKRALAGATGALAVDLESHRLAQVAGQAGLPLLVLRAVGDPAERAVPEAALAGLAPDGGTRPLAVAARLFAAPASLPGLLRVARDSAAGLRVLRRAAPCLTEPRPAVSASVRPDRG